MEHEEFERVVLEEFERLPELFRSTIDNLRIVVEDVPSRRLKRGTLLLGEYTGIPLTRRGADYGMYPVVPDTIVLYRRNLESIARDDDDLRVHIRETLIHEIGHYYGMSEADIRRAGY